MSHHFEMKNWRTCTTMIYTDGQESMFQVFRGPMRGRVFQLAKAHAIACYWIAVGQRIDYAAMTAAHAIPEAPPVPWQS